MISSNRKATQPTRLELLIAEGRVAKPIQVFLCPAANTSLNTQKQLIRHK